MVAMVTTCNQCSMIDAKDINYKNNPLRSRFINLFITTILIKLINLIILSLSPTLSLFPSTSVLNYHS